MAFRFEARLDGFDALGPNESLEVTQHLVDALTAANVHFLRSHHVPALYASGVHYCRDREGAERLWFDIPAALSHGCADCKSLAAWRAAELLVQGLPARAVVTTRNGILFHVVVYVRGAPTEDPSALLGM